MKVFLDHWYLYCGIYRFYEYPCSHSSIVICLYCIVLKENINHHGPLLLLAECRDVDVNGCHSMKMPGCQKLSNLLPLCSIKFQNFFPKHTSPPTLTQTSCNSHYSNYTTTPPHLPVRMIELSILTIAIPSSVLGRGLIVVQAVAPVVIFSVDERGVQLSSPRPPATISTCKDEYIHLVTVLILCTQYQPPLPD